MPPTLSRSGGETGRRPGSPGVGAPPAAVSTSGVNSATMSIGLWMIGISRVVAGTLPSAASRVTRGMTPSRRRFSSTTARGTVASTAVSTMSVSRSSGPTVGSARGEASTTRRRSVSPAFTARMTARSVTTPTRRRFSTANSAPVCCARMVRRAPRTPALSGMVACGGSMTDAAVSTRARSTSCTTSCSCISRRMSGSSAENASSISRMSVPAVRARAMPTGP